MTRNKLCILIPARNCAPFLSEILSRITFDNPDDEVIIVDDFSDDETFDVAKSLERVHVERNPRQMGYGGTSKQAYKIALERGADFAVNIHGDLGHPPEAVPALATALRRGECDVVLGSRYIYLRDQARANGLGSLLNSENRGNMPLSRIAGHASLTALQNVLYGTNYHSFHEGMRGVTRGFMEWSVSQSFPDWYDFDTRLIVAAHRAGWRIQEIGTPPFYTDEATSGVPLVRYGLRTLWAAVRDNRFKAIKSPSKRVPSDNEID